MSNQDIAVRARVTGRVQGVAFRAWTKARAEGLELKGWVRNEPDGSVSALIAGPTSAVRKLEQALWSGPPAAEVADVRIERLDPAAQTDAGPGFAIAG